MLYNPRCDKVRDKTVRLQAEGPGERRDKMSTECQEKAERQLGAALLVTDKYIEATIEEVTQG